MSKKEDKKSTKLEKLLEHYTETELEGLLNNIKKTPQTGQRYSLGTKNVRYGLISDSHIGNTCFDVGLMDLAARVFKQRKVDFVIHAGDICDGFYTHRPGHAFELEHIGADEQADRAVEELSKIEQEVFLITGNHTWNTFFKNAGMDIGRAIAERAKNVNYLGNAYGEIELANNVILRTIHPSGGTAYALSYKPQKIIEQIEGGKKPNVLHIGHFHKAEYLFYRNIHCFQAGCLEGQTQYMRDKGISAHKGFWVITLSTGKKGVHKIVPEFYPCYD